MKTLELGPGTAPLGSGYDTLDCFPHHNPTYLVDMANCKEWPIPDNTYDEVIAIHVLEHFELKKVQDIFRNVYRILKSGGSFRVHVPNGTLIAKAYLNSYITPNENHINNESVQLCIYGAESQEETKYHVAHKILYNHGLLIDQFVKNNFKNIKDVTDDLEYADRHDSYWHILGSEKFSLKVIGYKE